MKHTFAWLDIIRLFSVLLVIYAHFASVAGYATDIPLIIPNDGSVFLPLMDGPSLKYLNFDNFLLRYFNVQTGILGVTLFFLVTGFLMPQMLNRYSRIDFILNRIFRIFPLLIVSTLIIGLTLYILFNTHFKFKNYLASWTLTYDIIRIKPITGVLWTLCVELIFYILVAVIGKFTIKKLISLEVIILIYNLLFLYITKHFGEIYILNYIARITLFLSIILIGSAFNFYPEQGGAGIAKTSLIVSFAIISFFIVNNYNNKFNTMGTYSSFGTYVLAIFIFAYLYSFGPIIIKNLPKIITIAADLVYPLYLLHAALGLSFMAYLRDNLQLPPLGMITGALFFVILISWFAHYIIEKPFIKFGKKFIQNMP